MPYHNPSAGFYTSDAGTIAVALYRAVLDPIVDFGCTANGVADDSVAFRAALDEAAITGLPLYLPPRNKAGTRSVFVLTQEMAVSSAVTILGDSTGTPNNGPILRAGSALRSCMFIASSQTAPLAVSPSLIEGVVFDGGALAAHCMLLAGFFFGKVRRCSFMRALRSPVRFATHSTGYTLSAVTATVPGGSPAGVTVSQPEPTYGCLVAQTSISLVATSSSRFGASFNSGAVSAATQLIMAGSQSQLAYTSTLNFLADTGIRISWPAGGYHSGDHWDFVATPAVEVQPIFGLAINADGIFEQCSFVYAGTIYGSAGAMGVYGQALVNATVAGTVSTSTFVSGSTLVTGSGTQWLTGSQPAAYAGDVIWIGGTVGNAPVACVLDDTEIALPVNWIVPSVSGRDWALGIGAGASEDESTEDTRNAFDYCKFSNVPACLRTTGSTGGGIVGHRCRMENYGFAAHVNGPLTTALSSFYFSVPHIETGGASVNSQPLLVLPSVSGGLYVEPPEAWPSGTSANGFTFDYGTGAFGFVKGGVLNGFGTTSVLRGSIASTVGSAGIAAPLPSAPKEYIIVLDQAGSAVKVPAYNL